MATTPQSAPSIENQILAELAGMKANVDSRVETRLKDFKEEIVREVRQRTARGPFAGDAPQAQTTARIACLSSNERFRAWLSAPRSYRSSLALEVPFVIERKAVAPIANIGGTTHFGAIAGPPQPALRLGELLPHIPVAVGGGVEWTKETAFDPAADIVPETQLKPGTTLTFANVITAFKTIATITKASVQSLVDVPSLQNWIDTRLAYAVQLREEQYLLNDPAAGMLAAAQPLDAAYAPGAGATQLDVIGAAIGQLQTAGYAVDGIVLNGLDVNKTRLLKTMQGSYIWSSPDGGVGTAGMWGIPVVISPSIVQGTFLVGAFAQSTILFDRQVLQVDVSYENEDDFVKNLCTLRAEERVALAIPVPGGLITGSFGTMATEAAPSGKTGR